MTIEAKTIADSISDEGIRITTFQLRYPRFIHAEVKTHRILSDGTDLLQEVALMDDKNFSRNASSSRAIPVKKMIEDLRRDPAMPVYWGSNKAGMQAGEELTGQEREIVERLWLDSMEDAINTAQMMMDAGLHKQIANRILEPWAHINVVVTATDYANFYALRRHADAQPEIKALADAMWEASEASSPDPLKSGDWHLPYIEGDDWYKNIDVLKKVSVARCARVSYLTHDGRQTSIEEDVALYEKLVVSQPLHASPAEHQATPDIYFTGKELTQFPEPEGWEHSELHGNLRGWIQYRKTLENEFIPG